jgi:hypothetical protein
MLSRVSLGRGNSPPARTSSTHIIQGVLGIRFAPLLLYLRHAGFSTIFARFRRFSPDFSRFLYTLAPWPSGGRGTGSRNTETGGRAPARGGNADPRRPVAAAAPRGPPGPERRRRERRGEPRRPGARDPGAERPPGGQPGRSGQRGSASTVEGTATRARRDRLPRTPGARAGRRGGRRVGDSGAGGQRPGGPQADRPRKRAGPGTGAAGRIPR